MRALCPLAYVRSERPLGNGIAYGHGMIMFHGGCVGRREEVLASRATVVYERTIEDYDLAWFLVWCPVTIII